MTAPRKKPLPATEVVTLAAPPAPLASGDVLAGRYTMIELYGAGPLGYTYRARDAEGGGKVALKIVAHEIAPTPQERTHLVSELQKLVGREMSRVAVPIDAGLRGGHAYVVSPWIEGRSLRRVIGVYRDAGRFVSVQEALGIVDGVVLALRQLHQVTAHGALYPESVQISASGTIMLSDAGIAAAVKRARLIEHFERFSDVMPYLSPEVRGGKAPNAGSDLYALGALASELLTGDPGAAVAGIAGPMLGGMPVEVEQALAGLVAGKSARRAAALPVLMNALTRVGGTKSIPMIDALPRPRGRTDVMPVASELPRRGPRKRVS